MASALVCGERAVALSSLVVGVEGKRGGDLCRKRWQTKSKGELSSSGPGGADSAETGLRRIEIRTEYLNRMICTLQVNICVIFDFCLVELPPSPCFPIITSLVTSCLSPWFDPAGSVGHEERVNKSLINQFVVWGSKKTCLCGMWIRGAEKLQSTFQTVSLRLGWAVETSDRIHQRWDKK